ncbi:patatin-like phospholipase family protein [Niveibacterium terrae]|uniref:patatin-like phospholipase family protein n=1 Tax=Niveibacterium terrae TaxID=3373598 RepID=UPI003A90E301
MCESTALILTGGGARAAYQVGVLQAVRELWGDRPGNPFPILCGTSAGAINAVTLAVFAEDYGNAVDRLSAIWGNFHASQVYRSDGASVARSAAVWASMLAMGWFLRRGPHSLLDNTPLRELLDAHLDYAAIGRAIEAGVLRAVSVTCSGYASGESLSFFQAHPSVQPWRRATRIGVATRITTDHLLASSAIPFVFPAVKIHREFFGDGSLRQLAPISPAVQMGAERILVVGVGSLKHESRRVRSDHYPSLAQIAGHAMSSIFIDGLAVDLERADAINRTLTQIPEPIRRSPGFAHRTIETLVIEPSERLDFIAARHFKALPRAIRVMLRGVGAGGRSGSTVLSYLLFEKPYTEDLIHLGYRDAMARRAELAAFLRGEDSNLQADTQKNNLSCSV